MHIIKGIGITPGIAIGKAQVIQHTQTDYPEPDQVIGTDIAGEIRSFHMAIIDAIEEVESFQTNQKSKLQLQEIEILDTQIEFLNDPQIKADVIEKINFGNKTATDAVREVINEAALLLENLEDPYLKARSADIRDIGNRILKHLNHDNLGIPLNLPENSILIADDILPSDIIGIDLSKVCGIATRVGGKTSHTSILAKAKGIPMIAGISNCLLEVQNDDLVILNGLEGELIVQPDPNTLKDFQYKAKMHNEKLNQLKAILKLPCVTSDGHSFLMAGNISAPEELPDVFENGGNGTGLFRTEFMFMNNNALPSEDDQFLFYKKAAQLSGSHPITIRSLDIGGDKNLAYLKIPAESNPSLGYRAIRLCLDQQEIFLTQLRAILRASHFGKIRIMFPMICNLQELRQAKQCLGQAKEELIQRGIDFDQNPEIGIMIEIPSAALMTDILATEVDFISIGTNDLCQYALAVDRMNPKVSHLYNHFNLGVLRLIQHVIQEAHHSGRKVSVCGEMASDPLAALLLLGMGLDEFSMNAGSIPEIKNILIHNTLIKAQQIADKVLKMNDSEAITSYLQKTLS